MGVQETQLFLNKENRIVISEITPEYFSLQIIFAQKYSELTGINFDDCLTRRTCLYQRIYGSSPKVKTFKEEWERLINGIKRIDSSEGLTGYFYHVYETNAFLRKRNISESMVTFPSFGMFGITYNPERKIVFLHFINNLDSQNGLPNLQKIKKGKDYLKNVFSFIQNNYPAAEKVYCASWILNEKKLMSLFLPPEVIKKIKPIDIERINYWNEFLWGQFIDINGNIKKDLARKFLNTVNMARSREELIVAFPLQPQKAESSISLYNEFLGIKKKNPLRIYENVY